MIFGIEVVFLIVGLYALFTAKLPSWFVGKGYQAEGNNVRLVGGLMAAVLPAALCGGFTIGLVGGFAEFDPTLIVGVMEFLIVIAAAIGVIAWVQKIRKPLAPPTASTTNENQEPK